MAVAILLEQAESCISLAILKRINLWERETYAVLNKVGSQDALLPVHISGQFLGRTGSITPSSSGSSQWTKTQRIQWSWERDTWTLRQTSVACLLGCLSSQLNDRHRRLWCASRCGAVSIGVLNGYGLGTFQMLWGEWMQAE